MLDTYSYPLLFDIITRDYTNELDANSSSKVHFILFFMRHAFFASLALSRSEFSLDDDLVMYVLDALD